MRILIIEDEKRLSDFIKKGLIQDGFAVDQAFDGEEGQNIAEIENFDVIILDLMLPKIEGIKVCKNLRDMGIKTPIIMLTAKIRTVDKIEGLDSGADDYLTKPFEFVELKSRIYALLRRSYNQKESKLIIDDLSLDPIKHIVTRHDKEIKLTNKEFAILELLLRHKDELVTRTQIIEHVWDYNFDSMSNVVDVFIATLRKKVDGKSKNKLIHTIHGSGYKISAEQ